MKNSKGFTVIESLLILVLIGIIGGTGWYVYQAHNKAIDNLTAADAANSSTRYSGKQATTKNTNDSTASSSLNDIQAAHEAIITDCESQGETGCTLDTNDDKTAQNFVASNVSTDGSGWAALAKKIDNKWQVILRFQSCITKAQVAQYQIPESIAPDGGC